MMLQYNFESQIWLFTLQDKFLIEPRKDEYIDVNHAAVNQVVSCKGEFTGWMNSVTILSCYVAKLRLIIFYFSI